MSDKHRQEHVDNRTGEYMGSFELKENEAFVYNFRELSDMEAEADDGAEYDLERFASPQFGGICRKLDLPKLYDEAISDMKEFWSEDEDVYDWTQVEWEGLGFKRPDSGSDNLTCILRISGEIVGMLVVQVTEITG